MKHNETPQRSSDLLPLCDIEGEEFVDLEISDADITGGKLIDCTFTNCSIGSLKLDDATLQVSFHNCKIQGINFFLAKRSMMSLKFENCLIRYSSFAELNLPKSSFEGCTLEHVDFADAKLASACFRNAAFHECVFKNTDLSKADLRGARGYQIDPLLNKIAKARFELPEAVSLLAGFNIRLD